ncbi:MAG: hypothetical protein H8D96_01475 [Desulfobacterales bacterium]|uniref:DUF1016 family protein n=1 Tax=Candidatus Desulfatibia vada TaxID=2841696 RepID=A0A8J6TKP4_9BACT|nr:hypothetical protein [Candidatus Desulfatibia vada]
MRQDILKEKRAKYGEEIISTLVRQLSWSHFVEIISSVKGGIQHDFYAEMG